MDAPASAPVIPLQMRAGAARFSGEDPGYTLRGAVSSGKNRVFVGKVGFVGTFQSVPVVHLGLTGFDISNGDWARIEVRVGAITQSGFEVIAETWFNTEIHSFSVSWLALG